MKQKYVILPAISMTLLLTACGTNRKNNDNTDRAIRVTDENNISETVRATEPIRENHNNNNNNIIDDAGDVVDDVIDGGRDVVDDVADAGKDVVDDITGEDGDIMDDVENTENTDSNR